jgi:hypothetical protein
MAKDTKKRPVKKIVKKPAKGRALAVPMPCWQRAFFIMASTPLGKPRP